MLTIWMLTGVLVILLAYFLTEVTKRPKKFPPGPLNLPLVGYLPFMDFGNLERTLAQLSGQYGDVFSMNVGSMRCVVVNSWEAIKEAFSMQQFSGRPDIFSFTYFLQGKYGLVASDGRFWQEQRRFALRHLRDLGMGRNSIEVHIKEEVMDMISWFKEKKGEQIDISFELNISITNIIWAIVSGQRFQHDDPKILNLMNIINEILKLQTSSGTLNFMPFLINVLPDRILKLRQMRENDAVLMGFLKDTVKKHLETYQEDNMRDFTDMFIREMKENKETFTEWQLTAVLGDLLVAGGETTSTTLRWTVLFLSLWPDIQKKIQEEIDDVTGRNRLPTFGDRGKLPYTEAAIMEAQRLADLVPTGILHNTMEDVNFRGYIIPKDTVIIANHHNCHRDPKFWATPNEFNPQHFLDKEGNVLSKKESFLPFSVGKRQCAGESLAKAELFLFITCFLQTFTFRLPKGSTATIDPIENTGLIRLPRPYKIIAEERTD